MKMMSFVAIASWSAIVQAQAGDSQPALGDAEVDATELQPATEEFEASGRRPNKTWPPRPPPQIFIRRRRTIDPFPGAAAGDSKPPAEEAEVDATELQPATEEFEASGRRPNKTWPPRPPPQIFIRRRRSPDPGVIGDEDVEADLEEYADVVAGQSVPELADSQPATEEFEAGGPRPNKTWPPRPPPQIFIRRRRTGPNPWITPAAAAGDSKPPAEEAEVDATEHQPATEEFEANGPRPNKTWPPRPPPKWFIRRRTPPCVHECASCCGGVDSQPAVDESEPAAEVVV